MWIHNLINVNRSFTFDPSHGIQDHSVPLFKGKISGLYEPRGLSFGRTFNICLNLSKYYKTLQFKGSVEISTLTCCIFDGNSRSQMW